MDTTYDTDWIQTPSIALGTKTKFKEIKLGNFPARMMVATDWNVIFGKVSGCIAIAPMTSGMVDWFFDKRERTYIGMMANSLHSLDRVFAIVEGMKENPMFNRTTLPTATEVVDAIKNAGKVDVDFAVDHSKAECWRSIVIKGSKCPGCGGELSISFNIYTLDQYISCGNARKTNPNPCTGPMKNRPVTGFPIVPAAYPELHPIRQEAIRRGEIEDYRKKKETSYAPRPTVRPPLHPTPNPIFEDENQDNDTPF